MVRKNSRYRPAAPDTKPISPVLAGLVWLLSALLVPLFLSLALAKAPQEWEDGLRIMVGAYQAWLAVAPPSIQRFLFLSPFIIEPLGVFLLTAGIYLFIRTRKRVLWRWRNPFYGEKYEWASITGQRQQVRQIHELKRAVVERQKIIAARDQAVRVKDQQIAAHSAKIGDLEGRLQEVTSRVQTASLFQPEVDRTFRLQDELGDISFEVQALMELAARGPVGDYFSKFGTIMARCASSFRDVIGSSDVDRTSVILFFDDQDSQLKIVGSSKLDPALQSRKFSISRGFVGKIWAFGSDVCPDYLSDAYRKPEYEPIGDFRSMVGVPVLTAEGESLGVAIVQSKAVNAFVDRDKQVLALFTSFLGICFSESRRRKMRTNGETSTSEKVYAQQD